MEYPRSVHIDTFSECNGNCSICRLKPLHTGDLLDMNTLTSIAQDLDNLKEDGHTTIIQLGYASEFTHDPRAVEISNLFSNHKVVIITNGKRIEDFIQSGGYCSVVVFSILGGIHDDYSYEYITGNSLEDTISTIHRLQSAGIETIVALTVETIQDAWDMCRELDGLQIEVHLKQMYIPDKDTVESFNTRNNWDGISEQISEQTTLTVNPRYLVNCSNNYIPCPMAEDVLYINANGYADYCLNETRHDVPSSITWNGSVLVMYNQPSMVYIRNRLKDCKAPFSLCLSNPSCAWRFR